MTSPLVPDLGAVFGVAETALDDEFVATLPPNGPSAPWSLRASAVLWWCRAEPAATTALPPSLRGRVRPLVVVGGMVRYADSPVGGYDEVFAAVGFRDGLGLGATISFMAVDSPASLVGGRSNWSIPKTLAGFTGAPATGTGFIAQSATSAPWQVAATAQAKGPRVPVATRARLSQEFPDGSLRRTRLRARGWLRPAGVDVEVSSESELSDWLVPGRHPGVVVTDVRFTLDAPERRQA